MLGRSARASSYRSVVKEFQPTQVLLLFKKYQPLSNISPLTLPNLSTSCITYLYDSEVIKNTVKVWSTNHLQKKTWSFLNCTLQHDVTVWLFLRHCIPCIVSGDYRVGKRMHGKGHSMLTNQNDDSILVEVDGRPRWGKADSPPTVLIFQVWVTERPRKF